jgi:glutamate--cysteine ligase
MSSTPLGRTDLGAIFQSYERRPEDFLIGAESEKFGVHQETGAPLSYGGEFSVCEVLKDLEQNCGWKPIVEGEDGPVIGLQRGGASITLEPACQLELSGEPLPDLHHIGQESEAHLEELRAVTERMSIVWLGVGFQPLATLEELPWVPKQRYPIMREYLPKMGSGGLDMMQRTATVQGNFDWSSEEDAMRKLVVALKLAPLMQAWFSNAPFKEGKPSALLSERGLVWRHMDPARSGLIEALWTSERPNYQEYADWALQAGMFLIRRAGKTVRNTGQTFKEFMNEGFEGHRATIEDWKLHLNTLFPEARLKNTLEVRAVDSLPPSLALSSLAVWTGVLYDDRALDEVMDLVHEFRFSQIEAQREGLLKTGLHAPLMNQDGFHYAERLLESARGGLQRRARRDAAGNDEAVLLGPAEEILESRVLPAERILERYRASGSMIEATRLHF